MYELPTKIDNIKQKTLSRWPWSLPALLRSWSSSHGTYHYIFEVLHFDFKQPLRQPREYWDLPKYVKGVTITFKWKNANLRENKSPTSTDEEIGQKLVFIVLK